MAERRRDRLTEALRRQLLTELRAGARRAGDRLPSARVIGRQLGADPRVVLAAYRALAAEGLVELRERSGVFVARPRGPASRSESDDEPPPPSPSRTRRATRARRAPPPAPPSESWLADLFAQGVSRALPPRELREWLARATAHRLRAAVGAASADQVEGIRRELEDYFGVDAVGIPLGALEAWKSQEAGRVASRAPRLPAAVRGADFIVTTDACVGPMRRVAARLGKPFVSVAVRADLVGEEWQLLLRGPVYAVVTDARFAATMRHFFVDTPGVENLHAVVLGRDPLDDIPDDATVYVTHAARARLGDAHVPGRVVPPARVFSAASAREIAELIVRENLRRWGEGKGR